MFVLKEIVENMRTGVVVVHGFWGLIGSVFAEYTPARGCLYCWLGASGTRLLGCGLVLSGATSTPIAGSVLGIIRHQKYSFLGNGD